MFFPKKFFFAIHREREVKTKNIECKFAYKIKFDEWIENAFSMFILQRKKLMIIVIS